MTELQVGKQAPLFEMDAVMPDKSFGKVSLKENIQQEKWTVLFLSYGLYLCLPNRNYGYFRSI